MKNERIQLVVELKLDCGCWVTRAMSGSHGPDELVPFMATANEAIPHWFDRVALSHKCELVSDDNPAGVPRTN